MSAQLQTGDRVLVRFQTAALKPMAEGTVVAYQGDAKRWQARVAVQGLDALGDLTKQLSSNARIPITMEPKSTDLSPFHWKGFCTAIGINRVRMVLELDLASSTNQQAKPNNVPVPTGIHMETRAYVLCRKCQDPIIKDGVIIHGDILLLDGLQPAQRAVVGPNFPNETDVEHAIDDVPDDVLARVLANNIIPVAVQAQAFHWPCLMRLVQDALAHQMVRSLQHPDDEDLEDMWPEEDTEPHVGC